MTHHDANPFQHKPTTEELLARMWDKLEYIAEQVTLTNGRVTGLESRERVRLDAEATRQHEAEAYERGVRDALAAAANKLSLTRRQKAALVAAFSAATVVAPFVGGMASGRW